MNWNDIFIYDDGVIRWNIKPGARSNVSIGDSAGSLKSCGYLRFKYKGKTFAVHRIIWEMHNGQIPDGMEIDHINHIRTDNRIENLRLVSRLTNMKNKSMYANNSSGATGVRWDSRLGKWISRITTNGKIIYLGSFDNINDAITARNVAEAKIGFHDNHGDLNNSLKGVAK